MAHSHWSKLHSVIAALALFVSSARADTTPVFVEVAVSTQVLDAGALRAAIGKELDCPVTMDKQAAHSGEILIKPLSAGQVAVTFATAERLAPLRRVVTLPQTPEHRVQLIAWLVGNMARNEAAEWLANHQREKDEEAKAAAQAKAMPASAPGAEAKPAEPAAPPEAKVKPDLSVGNAANKQNGDKILIAGATRPATQPVAPRPDRLTYHGFNLALWHPLELHPDAETSRFGFHLGVGYGHVGAIRGFGFDGLHHRSDVEVQGVASSFVWTRVNRTEGVAFSLGIVTAKQPLRGVDYAGLVAYRDGDVTGGQVANFVTYANGDVSGVQLAGLFAWSGGDVSGAQAAFGFTRQAGSLHGFQLSLVANLAKDVAGVQFGALNVGKDVQGVQFGLVNVAQKVDGVAIGLVNISDNVRTQPQVWAERNYLENVGVRYAYSTLTFGVSSGYDSANDRERFLFGLGARFAYQRFAFAPCLDVGFVIDDVRTQAVGRGHENDVRLGFELDIVPKVLGIMAGPTLALRSDSGRHLEARGRWFAGLNLF